MLKDLFVRTEKFKKFEVFQKHHNNDVDSAFINVQGKEFLVSLCQIVEEEKKNIMFFFVF